MLVSSFTYAAQCTVDVQNEVHLDGHQVKIFKEEGAKVVIDQNNDLYISGEKITLNAIQQKALDSYRNHMSEYAPQMKKLGNDSMVWVNDIMDEVSASFDNSTAFDGVKKSVNQFFSEMENKYYQNDELILKKHAFSSFRDNWASDFKKIKESFNAEFFSSAFAAVSEKMQKEGGINFSALNDNVVALKAKLESKIKANSQELKKKADGLCSELNGLAQEEQQLHKTIPQLENYQVFSI